MTVSTRSNPQNSNFVREVVRTGPGPALDKMQILPRALIISLRAEVRHIDDEAIALPMAARVAVPLADACLQLGAGGPCLFKLWQLDAAVSVSADAPSDGSSDTNFRRHQLVERSAGQSKPRVTQMHAALHARSDPIHAADGRRRRAPRYASHTARVMTWDHQLNADDGDINGKVGDF
jgi:hypothetical protein